jgi:hypothetical protein
LKGLSVLQPAMHLVEQLCPKRLPTELSGLSLCNILLQITGSAI